MVKIPSLQEFRKALWHLRHGGLKQLKAHRRRVATAANISSPLLERSKGGKLTIQPWPIRSDLIRRPHLNVAVILDEFSTLAWQFEWNQFPVTPNGWRQTFDGNSIDLLFVESAWHGNDDAWQFKLTGSSAPSGELRDLVVHCKDNGIPTVFWNKEDPVHFDDFIETAKIFDYVYTSDAELVATYRKSLEHPRVDVLPFAAQPAIHNPVRPKSGFHSRDIAFGGMYFAHRHKGRQEQIELLLGAASDVSSRMDYGLEIYSRFHGTDTKYQFPDPLYEKVKGSLTYRQMLSAYRLHKVFLNVNTISDSSSMCARRIFEITASGTPVVSTPSPAIKEFFPSGGVIQVSDREEAALILRALVRNPELRERLVHQGQREIWKHHTYEIRANQILAQVGMRHHQSSKLSASILISTNRPNQVEHALEMAKAQVSVKSETLILTHGFELSQSQVDSLSRKYSIDNLEFLTADSSKTLGDCLNQLVEASSGDVVAKFDDDDYYAPHYLFDQIQAMQYSQAEIVGKRARYIFLENSKNLVLRSENFEHVYTDFVAGPTIVATRQCVKSIPFESRSVGEDTAFLNRAIADGGKIYAADKFNFIQYRRQSADGNQPSHTWQASDWELTADARFVTNEWLPSHVNI